MKCRQTHSLFKEPFLQKPYKKIEAESIPKFKNMLSGYEENIFYVLYLAEVIC